MRKRDLIAVLTSSVCIIAMAAPAEAQAQTFRVPAGSLKAAIDTYARQTGRQIIYKADEIASARSPGVQGNMSADMALTKLLRGTAFSYRIDASGAIAITSGETIAGSAAADSESADIVVTGSRIRGAPSTSPVSTVTRDEALRSGQNDLGEVIRDLPQNYSGGQNPTIAGGGQASFTNTAGSSALNLRGLGPDATLTLINGHRVAFDAISQGVDISSIPLGAIDRIDVMTDGASALYGSDAVGGVANVILRRDYEGLATSARLGSTTDGGAMTQQYDAVTGHKWRTGGFMVAADYVKSSEISAGDRSYTGNVYPTYTLIPESRQFSAVVAGHQKLGESITLALDGNYLHRTSYRCLTTTGTADCTDVGDTVATKVNSYSVTPSIKVDLPHGWSAKVSGTYSKSDTYVTTSVYSGGNRLVVVLPKYFDTLKSVEAGAEGPLFNLPGGQARLALGAGYRSSRLDVDSRSIIGGKESTLNLFGQSQDVAFAYGELFVPIVSPANDVPFLRRLQFVGAIRHENYRHLTSITTPKLGVVYAPASFIELKGSWGKSFKAPTLYQSGQTSNAQLVNSSAYIPAPPSTLPVLYLYGGNAGLKPERATTWTISSTIKPAFLPGFELEGSYFNIRYRNRVAEPLLSGTAAFQSIYSNYVQLNPSAQAVLAAIDSVTGSFTNLTAGSFDPSAVSAIVYDQLQNVSALHASGVDLSARYRRDMGERGRLTFKGTATYFTSDRQITPQLPL